MSFPHNNAIFLLVSDERPRKICNYICFSEADELEVTPVIDYLFDLQDKNPDVAVALASRGYIPNLKPCHFKQAFCDLTSNPGGDISPWSHNVFETKTISCSLSGSAIPTKKFYIKEFWHSPGLIDCKDLLINYELYQKEYPSVDISAFFDGTDLAF